MPLNSQARSWSGWRAYLYRLIAFEISAVTRYCDRLLQWDRLESDPGQLLDLVDCQSKGEVGPSSAEDLPAGSLKHTVILMNGTLNTSLDVHGMLQKLKARLDRSSRIVAVAYNPYYYFLLVLSNLLKLRTAKVPLHFLTHRDLVTLAKLAGYEIVRLRPVGYFPFRLLGLGDIVNAVLPLVPLFRWLSFAGVVVLRPIVPETRSPTISVVIPARNEKGTIEAALQRLPERLRPLLEIVFVEGHSKDDTWAEIQRVATVYASQFKIIALQQTGVGKKNAVEVGFAHATGDTLTILDADLSVPPEQLEQFYDAYCSGLGDFINGNRLVYPMESGAMQFLNVFGNKFFAKSLSYVLELDLGDALCGTKFLSRDDYVRICRWCKDFGDFDPFGDFELLFGAAALGLGSIDFPIAYKSRVYGETNISRFWHGFMLLRMTLTGLIRLRLGTTR